MTWGAIGGATASAVVGGMMAGGGSDGGTQSTVASPFSTNSGLFSTSWGKGVNQNTGVFDSLSPARQAQILQAINGGGGGGGSSMGLKLPGSRHSEDFSTGGGGGPDMTGWSPRMMQAYQDMQGSGGRGLNMQITDPRLRRIERQGLQGAGLFFNQAMNNPNADMARQLGLDFMGQMNADPMQVAQHQFDLMNPMLRQNQEQDYMGLESRLFSQGQLGGGGYNPGQNSLNALFDSQGDQTRQLMYDSLGQGMGVQAQNANLANLFSNLDPQLRGQFLNLGSGMLNIPLALQQAMVAQASLGGNLAGTNVSGGGGGTLSPIQTFGNGLMNNGINSLNDSVNSWFKNNTAGGSYTDTGPGVGGN